MIPIPSGWSIRHLPDALLLMHPTSNVTIHYRERAGAPRAIGVLAREILACWPHLEVRGFGEVERFLTDDDELAALVTASCVEDARVVQVTLGFVFTDDFFSSMAATCRDPLLSGEIHATVRALVRADSHALGVRRRRFEYTPPATWQPYRRSLATEWLPPGYPAHSTTLVAYPANPIDVVGRGWFGDMHTFLEEAGWHVLDVGPLRRGTNAHALAFEEQEVLARRPDGSLRRHCVVLLGDSRYQYPLELRVESADLADADRAVLRAVVDSVVPFRPPVRAPMTSMQHWID